MNKNASLVRLALAAAALVISPCAKGDDLGNALNAPYLTWATSSTAPWFAENTNSYDGVSAARSGVITNAGGSSSLSTTVTGRVDVVFWWHVATTNSSAGMNFYTNGSYVTGIWGSNAWTRQTISFDSGTNPVQLQWIAYMPWSDPTNWIGSAGYLDDVLVTNIAGLKPVVLAEPPAVQLVPDNYQAYTYLNTLVIGDIPMSYQWQRNGTNLLAGYPFYNTTTATLSVWDFTSAQNDKYRLVASNNWGMVTGAVCTVSVTNSPPFIASWYELQDTMIALGDCYSISTYGSGTLPLHYQWLSNGVPVASATNSYYEFCPALAAASAIYRAAVTNAYGAVTTSVAQVTISTALPVIDDQPSPEYTTVAAGDSGSAFWVSAEGPQYLYYNWKKIGDDTNYGDWQGGPNFDSYDPTNSGLYYATISNFNGSVTSRVSVLAVAPVDPIGVAIDAPSLSISNDFWNPWAPDVSGTNDHDGLCAAQSYPIWGYESSSFAVTNLTGPTNVSFWCRIDAATATHLDMIVDGNVSNTISGQTSWQQFSYSLPAGQHTLTWTFRKDYADQQGAGAAWVDQLVLSGSAPPPPPSGTFTTGGDVDWYLETTNVFSAPDAWQSGALITPGSSWLQTTVTGPGVLSFMWKVSSGANVLEVDVDGNHSNSISGNLPWIPDSLPILPGPHVVTWTYHKLSPIPAYADAGWVDDVVFTPIGGQAPTITTQPTNVMVKAGDPAELDVTASGDNLKYQWYADSNAVLNATNESLIFNSSDDTNNATYYVVVSNSGGSIQSSNATLTVVTPPTINYGPYYDTEDVGGIAWFSVSVSGSDPLYFQWYKLTNTVWVPIVNATNNPLEISNLTTNDAAWYHVVVTNWAGSYQSGPARLTVDVPPSIIAQSQNQTNYVGSIILLWVDATGTVPMNYYWYKDGKSIATTTFPYYTCTNAQITNSGAYTVWVSGPSGAYATTTTPMNVVVQPVPTNASPGTVDRSFNFGLGASGASCVIPLTNGQIIIGGAFTSVNGIERHGLARLNADGSLDALWDPQLNNGANVFAMLPQPNGAFVIGGAFTSVNGLGRTNVARLNADGSPDPGFNPGAGPNSPVSLMAATPDGGMIICGGGITHVAGIARTNLAKLTSTGSVDTSFNAGTGVGVDIIYSLACQGSSVLVGGYIRNFSGHACGSILRLNPDGSFDTNFTPASIMFNGYHGDVDSITVQPDGRILVAGVFGPVGTGTNSGLARLTTNGLYDATFAPPIGTTAYENGSGNVLKVLGNGQILFACGSLFGYPNTRVVRLNTNGTVDGSFTTNGAVIVGQTYALDVTSDGHVVVAGSFSTVNGMVFHGITSLNSDGTLNPTFRPGFGSSDGVRAIAVQPDGKIVIGGDFTNVDYAMRSGVARVLSDGSLDANFNVGSGASTSYGPLVTSLALYSNGCVLVGGTFTNFNGVSSFYLTRLLTNGTVDPAFTSPFNATDSRANSGDYQSINAIAVQPDGKILVGGNFWSVGGVPAGGIARLLPNGSLDTSMQTTNAPGEVEAIKLLPNGQIYVAGYYILLARLNSDGTRDSSFAPTWNNIGGSVYAMELLPDGRVVIGNNSSLYQGSCLIRFNPDGTRDSSFYSGYGSAATVTTLALQSDGELVVGGTFAYFNGPIRQRLARVNEDGSLDLLFNPTPYNGGGNGSVYSLAALTDGRVLVGGQFFAVSDRTMSSTTLGRDNLMAINTENPAVSALPVGPTIIGEPQGGNVNIGGSITLSVAAVGTPPLGYQWYKNNLPIHGATQSSLTFNPIVLTNAGSYFVIVSNAVNTAQSSPAASIWVYPPYSWDPAGRSLTLNWNGVPGHTYEVLSSTSGNLAKPGNPPWTVLYQFTATTVNCSWFSPSLSAQTNGFFRIVDVTGP